jgi:hypothetical protein
LVPAPPQNAPPHDAALFSRENQLLRTAMRLPKASSYSGETAQPRRFAWLAAVMLGNAQHRLRVRFQQFPRRTAT